MKYGTIFSDMDGVLVNFDAGCRKAMGFSPNDSKHSHMTQAELAPIFKEHCNTVDFWANLPPMPDFQQYWGYIKYWSPGIITAYPSWDKKSADIAKKGKMAWNRKHTMVPESRFHCVARKDKKMYAINNGVPNILIDDHEKNIIEWEAKGGTGILHTSAVATITRLKVLGFRKAA